MLLGSLDIPYKFGAVKKELSFDTGHQKVQGGPLLVIKPAGEGERQTFRTRLRLGAGTNEDEKFTSCWSSHFRIVLFFLRIPLSCESGHTAGDLGSFTMDLAPCFALLGRAPPQPILHRCPLCRHQPILHRRLPLIVCVVMRVAKGMVHTTRCLAPNVSMSVWYVVKSVPVVVGRIGAVRRNEEGEKKLSNGRVFLVCFLGVGLAVHCAEEKVKL